MEAAVAWISIGRLMAGFQISCRYTVVLASCLWGVFAVSAAAYLWFFRSPSPCPVSDPAVANSADHGEIATETTKLLDGEEPEYVCQWSEKVHPVTVSSISFRWGYLVVAMEFLLVTFLLAILSLCWEHSGILWPIFLRWIHGYIWIFILSCILFLGFSTLVSYASGQMGIYFH